MHVRSYKQRSFALPVVAIAGASLLFAACSSGKASTATSGNTTPTTAASDAAFTVSVSNVPGVGNVLVDGNGRTLYILQSEKGGKVNCTSSDGCTTIWPPVVLPSGMAQGIAGNGAQASLLGTVTAKGGDVRLTYNGWPLYTFQSDTAPGQAKGQNLKDVYGLWFVLNAAGNPVTPASSSTATTAAKAPITGAPATSPPATSPPATSPHATSPPATSPPTTSAPATTAPSSGGAGF